MPAITYTPTLTDPETERTKRREPTGFAAKSSFFLHCLHPLQLHRAVPSTTETHTYYPGCQTRRVRLDAFRPPLSHGTRRVISDGP